MKANTLMNGDLVRIKNLKDPIKRLVCVDEYLGKVDFLDGKELFTTSVDNVLPIPLTVEILEKNGFKCLVLEPSSKRTYSCNEPPISCTFIPNRGWHLSAGPVGSTKLPFAEISKAYYVHQLQHILRDAGIEKEITIE
jgi:hypothetical protein